MKLSTYLVTYEELKEQYPRKDFISPAGYCFGIPKYVFLVKYYETIIGWFVFSVMNSKKKIIYQTGTWVTPRFRKREVGKILNIGLINELDNKYGKGKYIFETVLCSLGGIKIWNHRISLTSNPKSHIFIDEYHNSSKRQKGYCEI